MHLNPNQREEVKIKITNFLVSTINDFERRFYEEKSKSIKGWLQGRVTDLSGMFSKIEQDIPVFTEQILDFLSHEDNRDKVTSYIVEKFTNYTDRTFSRVDYSVYDHILSHYKYEDYPRTRSGLKDIVSNLDQQARQYSILVYAVVILCGLMIALGRSITRTEFLLFTCICIGLLSVSLFLPMIEIDARIEAINFSIFGEPAEFTDQVLYYKSKSIIEVVQLMLSQAKWDVFLVGMLVLLFSVIFPVLKLLSSLLYIYLPRLHSNRIIRFMVFHTSKWSMADVMVVAIFMSYIGFSSILTEQLNQLEGLSKTIDVLTTNQSSLQVGFFLFTSFALLSLLIAQKLQYAYPEKEMT